MILPNGRSKMNVYIFPKTDANPIIFTLYLFGLVLSRVICHPITRFGTLYAESLLMYVKPVFLTITQGCLKMLGKDFMINKTRCLLNEFIEPTAVIILVRVAAF